MQYRTDLAVEEQVLSGDENSLPAGISMYRESRFGVEATVVEIQTKSAQKLAGKPKGTYITLEAGAVLRREKESFEAAVSALGEYLRELLSLDGSLPVLVAGLGNRDVTPDALGPMTADHILVTRHMIRAMPEEFGLFRPVSALVPGVLGTTGVESAQTVRALTERTGAAAVIAVDALAARDTKRLCSTIQISTAGIAPGSGIGNCREGLNEDSVGVPVIGVGVPTVTDAATMAADLMERTGREGDEEALRRVSGGLVVTAGDIDRRVRELSRVLAYGINFALQPNLSLDDLTDLTF